ncbi:unnamed protein product [Prorocentrum cordatum]|uniref:Dihydrolipoyl dehydrogenase n=1 Tax=Prorocentrum cordatum TaxID=2364126 RepID=A0ABN9RX86_9DINO|nr:unnamed protein product [Polarella glacialis]
MMSNKAKSVTMLTKGIEMLFKANKVDYAVGHGTLTGPNSVKVALNAGGEQVIEAKNIMLATGSEVMSLPGIELDEKGRRIVSSTGALELDKVPERLTVIGGGVIGLELGSVWARLGSKVTVVEFMDSIGGLGIDSEVAKNFLAILKKQGMEFQLKTKVTGVKKVDGVVEVSTEPAAGGETSVDKSDVVLVCVGRRQFMDNLGLESIGVEMDGKKVKVDHNYMTNVPGVYAIGDIVQGPMLAHKAEDEGALLSEYLATGKSPHLDYNTVPSVIYTYPEVAWVGKTEEQLKAEGVAYKKGKFVFGANSRAKCVAEEAGFVKVLADKATDKLLGVHIVNALAGELIAEACVGIEYGAASEDLARVCHAHPTLSEALKGAAQMTAFGKVLPHTTLIPNINLRNMIESLTQRMPALQRQQLRQLRERQDLEAILAALAEGQEKALPGAPPPGASPQAAVAGRGAGAPARASESSRGPRRGAETNPFRRMLAEKEHVRAAFEPGWEAASRQPPAPNWAAPPPARAARSTSAGVRRPPDGLRCGGGPSAAAAARRPSRSASPFGAEGGPPAWPGPPDAGGGGWPSAAAAARRPLRSASPFGAEGAQPSAAWPGPPRGAQAAGPVQWVTFGAGPDRSGRRGPPRGRRGQRCSRSGSAAPPRAAAAPRGSRRCRGERWTCRKWRRHRRRLGRRGRTAAVGAPPHGSGVRSRRRRRRAAPPRSRRPTTRACAVRCCRSGRRRAAGPRPRRARGGSSGTGTCRGAAPGGGRPGPDAEDGSARPFPTSRPPPRFKEWRSVSACFYSLA